MSSEYVWQMLGWVSRLTAIVALIWLGYPEIGLKACLVLSALALGRAVQSIEIDTLRMKVASLERRHG